MKRLIFALAVATLSSACAAGSLQPGAENVLRTNAAQIEGCEDLGTIQAHLLSMRQDYEIHRSLGYSTDILLYGGHRRDLFIDARNRALALGGNRVIPMGAFKDDGQPWKVYRCRG